MEEGGDAKPEVTPGDKSSNKSFGMKGPQSDKGAEWGPLGGPEAAAGEDVATGDVLTDEGSMPEGPWKPGGTEGAEDLRFLPSLSLKTEKASSL